MESLKRLNRRSFLNPASATYKANQLAASQDPLAPDYRTAKNTLYPIANNPGILILTKIRNKI